MSIAVLVAFSAFFASHHVLGLTPFRKNVVTAARLTQIIFTSKSCTAPGTSAIWFEPTSIPTVTVGGKRATATITPISALGRPLVNASVPATPAASAIAISPSPT